MNKMHAMVLISLIYIEAVVEDSCYKRDKEIVEYIKYNNDY